MRVPEGQGATGARPDACSVGFRQTLGGGDLGNQPCDSVLDAAVEARGLLHIRVRGTGLESAEQLGRHMEIQRHRRPLPVALLTDDRVSVPKEESRQGGSQQPPTATAAAASHGFP